MMTFKEFLAELTTGALNRYRRGAEEDMEHEIQKGKPNWDRVSKRQHGIEYALSKIKNVDVKVKASDSKRKPWRMHPIRVISHDK